MINQSEQIKDFDAIKISIASSETIRSWSYGEVKKPETVNYRTFQPETDGLFCERIFGPTKNYECGCGKYKGKKYKGVICEKCGVEVTVNRVRRERMGHIELAFPVVHEWFFWSVPSRISIILNRSERDLTRVLYFEKYVILDPGATNYPKYSIITKQEYNDILENMPEYERDTFRIGIGAEAIREMLESINLKDEMQKLSEEIEACKLDIRKKKLVRRLKLLKAFDNSGSKLGDLVLTALPVLPPELRPLVQLDGGRFATSDLNDLYRRVINRNNRLKKLLEYGIIPDVVLRNEQRMLQESVDSLFNNAHRGAKAVTGTGKRPLKSLSDMIKGKQGRFRQNLLGKRVDYSGRSVITVGPNLKLHQCGLPKDMALELFLPFVYAKLQKYGLVTNLKAAQKLVEQNIPEIWDILEEVMREHPVLLNRAPTLHRLSIQAFEPILMDGKSIRLHPLVCPAFNADFDGDQMAVHVPLSIEAQLESRILMLSTNNLLSPATGKPIVVPSKDIVLGIYYITMDVHGLPNENHAFSDINEINYALENKIITYQTKIKTRVPYYSSDGEITYQTVETTPGRVIFSQILPHHQAIPFDFINKTMTSAEISNLIDLIHFNCGSKSTAIFVDKIMAMGFKYMTVSGISYGKDDLIVPRDKAKLVQEAKQSVNEFEQQYLNGFITKGEKYNKVIDVWNKCGDTVAESLMKEISHTENGKQPNSVYMMVHSKARGSMAQLKQSAGMRGLMAKPTGEIIETPIVSSFKEGLSVLEYFISTHGSRKGLTDTALKTANSGYLTRRLVDVANDCVVCEEDCGTTKGIHVKPIYDDTNTIISLSERILGRFTACDIIDPRNGMLIVPQNGYIDEYKLQKILDAGIDTVYIRSLVTCESKHGVCTKCYGRDLAIGKVVSVGEAVGVIAAQSIGEPGTQLTMRTFHIGGTAQQSASKNSITATVSGKISLKNIKIAVNSYKESIVLSKQSSLAIIDNNGKEVSSYILPYGSKLKTQKGASVKAGDVLAEWDPYTIPIISEIDGIVKYMDLISDVSLKETTDDLTGISNKIVIDWKKNATNNKLKPELLVVDSNDTLLQLSNGNEAKYSLSIDTIIAVENGAKIKPGDTLAKMPKNIAKTKDITGGLPKISELFEARTPQSPAVLAEMDGIIKFGKDYKDKRKIKLIGKDKKEVEYVISKDRPILVRDGENIKHGDVIVDGNIVLHDLLRILGVEIAARHFIDEIQKVYRLQGVPINDKHIEVIMRQMLRKREIINTGDSDYIVGDEIDKIELEAVNTKLLQNGKSPIIARTVLEGITKAAIKTQSFISAASFQETARVLTEAAINGKKDYLHGLKENVIIGRLIPAGTGNMVRQWKNSNV